MSAANDGKYGTNAGYGSHQYYGTEPCDACREAKRRYMARYRKAGMPGAIRAAQRNRAVAAALWRLKDLHRADFDLLVEDEMRIERARERAAS